MALKITGLKLPLTADESSLPERAARALRIRTDDIVGLRLVRTSLDARKKQDIYYACTVEVQLHTPLEKRILGKALPGVEAAQPREPVCWPIGEKSLDAPIAVVGLGPGGLFAAHALASQGYAPLVIERGQPVTERSSRVARFFAGGPLDPDSNVMFGEGGAGAFSDGKLTTRIKDPWAHWVLELLAAHGAPGEILVQAKPHLGTDRLVQVVQALREDIQSKGGQVCFQTKLTGLVSKGGQLTALELETPAGKHIQPVSACILAIGQGARDTYRMLYAAGLEMQPKAFAVGVRAEHPRALIDQAQFGAFAGHPRLGAAEYQLTARHESRGVYTFCMCPGGVVVASSSSPGQVVTNGMSYHARDGQNSNAAIVVQVEPKDFGYHPLDGIRFQERMEEAAFRLGGGDYTAPAQRICDFLRGEQPGPFGGVIPTYRPGVAARSLSQCLPDFVTAGIQAGIRQFGQKLRGYDLPDGVLTAAESPTSAPVRILRDGTGQAPTMAGLYPVGEGAGYAGGIVSAAVDGLRAAERLMALYKPIQ